MNYKKAYDSICERGQTREIVGYIEKHHIVMRSHGGSDDASNITHLTAREHFIAHWLLARMYPTDYRAQAAFKMMADVRYRNRYTPSSRAVAEARERAAKLSSEAQKGKKIPRAQVEKMIKTITGRKHSVETKSKIQKSLIGRSRPEIEGRVHINNGVKSKVVPFEKLQEYKNQGYQEGRLPVKESTRKLKSQQNTNRRWINNGITNKYPDISDLPYYIGNGFVLGRLIISKN
jgi:hypothetical protein